MLHFIDFGKLQHQNGKFTSYNQTKQLYFKKAEKSITFSDNQYQIAIPWKENKLQLPDNYRVALNRLRNLER